MKVKKIFLKENRIVHIMTLPCVLLMNSFKLIVSQQTKYSPEGPLTIEWGEGIYHATIDLAYAYIWLTSSWNDKILDQLMCKISTCSKQIGLLEGPFLLPWLGKPFFSQGENISKTKIFRDVNTILNERKHLKIVFRSVSDSVTLFLDQTDLPGLTTLHSATWL